MAFSVTFSLEMADPYAVLDGCYKRVETSLQAQAQVWPYHQHLADRICAGQGITDTVGAESI